MRKLTLLLVTLLLLSSCASILNSKYQKVTINTSKNNKVLINGEVAETKKGKYLLLRDRKLKQITVKQEGYKDEHITVMQYKRSPLYIMSWIPFVVVYFIPPLLDRGPKAFNYDKEIEIGKKMLLIPEKDNEAKEIKLNNVGIDIEANNIRYRWFSTYKNFKRNEEKTETSISEENEKVELKNTIFSGLLNELLKEKGYIDTTRKVLKNSYLNNLLIDATIRGYTVHTVANSIYGNMVYVDLNINWEVLDYYKKSIYSQTTKSKSGQFAVLDYNKKDKVVHNAIKDAMEYGLIEFMNSEKVVNLLHDKSEQKLEESFEEIYIPKSSSYVSNLSQAIKSSVTIKNKDWHGSGFIISSNGYVITNYHVVSDTTDLKVIMNDESEYDVDIVRVSKIYDLALLKIDAKNLIPFTISKSKNIEIALDIFVVGTPTAEDLSQTISKGIISGIRKIAGNSKLIQTDASINAGNSGGVIVNKKGLVLGIVSSKLKGFGIEGVAFGIPAYEIFDRLKITIK